MRPLTRDQDTVRGAVREGAGVRLRIAHVITKGRPMGGSQLDTFYAVRFERRSHDVEVIMGNEGPLGEACRSLGVPVRVIPIKNRLVDPLGDALALIRLVAHFRRTRPDLVHTHTSKAGILGRVAARLAGVPIVVHSLHSPPFHDRQPAPIRFAIRLLERLWAPMTDRFVSVCHALGDTFVQAGICTADRMRMVPSGLDFEAFPSNPIETRRAVREALGIDPGADVVISVAELTKDKGHDTLIEAAAEIVAHRRDVVFLIVGPGALHDQLQQEIDRRNLNGHVRLLGARGDVPDLLVAADVFVQTSWREGLSRSLLEAMYSGLAVVATDVGATREVVQQGQTGLLISPGDTAALAAGLLELLAQPAERARLASRARAEIGATRDLDTVGEAFDALYLELATHKGMGRSQVMPATGARAERAGSVR